MRCFLCRDSAALIDFHEHMDESRNVAQQGFVIDELLRAFSARSHEHTMWHIGLLSNLRLFVIVAVSLLFQLLAHDLPGLAVIFGREPGTVAQRLRWPGLGAVPLIVLEWRKVRRRASLCSYTS